MKRIESNLLFTRILVPSLLIRALLAWPNETDAATYYVATNGNDAAAGTNWATAVQTIQAAVDKSIAGDTVLVSNGVYQTGGRVVGSLLLTNRVVIDKPILVQSVNGPAVTIIRGAKDPITLSNGNAAVRCVWMTNDSALVGFTLTNGATRTGGDFDPWADGGGLWAQSSSVVVSNCIIAGNSAHHEGGGTYRGTLNHCTLTGNSAGSQGGGAIFCTINNSRLIGNTAPIGGGVMVGILKNCVLYGNVAEDGGGAFDSTLNNCTIVGNTATVGIGGGAEFSTLKNCIVYYNSENYGMVNLSYTCTTPIGPGGPGVFTNEPMFVDLAATNLQLASGSPCRDTGNNVNAPGSTDLAGNARIVNAVVDRGAFEYQSGPSPDYDGDGMSNADETIAGSSAVNSNDVWKIASITVTNPASITFATAVGSLYAVDRNDALVPNPQVWTEFTNNIPGTGSPIIITDPLPGTNRNYRVRVQLAP